MLIVEEVYIARFFIPIKIDLSFIECLLFFWKQIAIVIALNKVRLGHTP